MNDMIFNPLSVIFFSYLYLFFHLFLFLYSSLPALLNDNSHIDGWIRFFLVYLFSFLILLFFILFGTEAGWLYRAQCVLRVQVVDVVVLLFPRSHHHLLWYRRWTGIKRFGFCTSTIYILWDFFFVFFSFLFGYVALHTFSIGSTMDFIWNMNI